MTHGLTGSKVDLASHCGYWARPDVERPYRPSGKAARIGTRVHKLAELYIKGEGEGQFLDLEEEKEARALWATLKTWLPPKSVPIIPELPLLYDAATDTATECKMGEGERDYLGVDGMKIPMRLDIVVRNTGDLWVEVWDIKTGSQSNQTVAAENLQLRTQALAASRFFEATRIKVGLVYPMKTKVKTDVAELSKEVLDEHARFLRRTLMRLPIAKPNLGQHCYHYCPVGPQKGFMATCPAWRTEEESAAE